MHSQILTLPRAFTALNMYPCLMNVQDPIKLQPLSNTTWAIIGFLRFLLASIVVNSHLGILGTSRGGLSQFINSFGAFAAVSSFVVISGFSIADSWHREPKKFLIRRFARIYPVLAVTIFIYIIAVTSVGMITLPSGFVVTSDTNFKVIGLASILFLNGILVGQIYGPCWSLTAEFWYYFSAPLIGKLNLNRLNLLLMLFSVIYFVLGTNYGVPLPNTKYGIAIFALAWFWIAGYVLRITLHTELRDLQVIVVLLLALFLFPVYNYEGGIYSKVTLMTTVIVIVFAQKIKTPSMATSTLSYLGDLSYPLFMVHYGVIILATKFGISDYFICLTASILIALVFLHIIDRPLRKILTQEIDEGKQIKNLLYMYLSTAIFLWILISLKFIFR